MTTKSMMLALAGSVASLALMTGAGLAQSSEPFRLILTHLEPPLVPNSVMDLAAELGYFEAEGVDVELVRVQQTPSAIAALQSGEGEMANIGVDALLQVIHNGATDFRAVTSPNKSLPFLIASKDDIATPADLPAAALVLDGWEVSTTRFRHWCCRARAFQSMIPKSSRSASPISAPRRSWPGRSMPRPCRSACGANCPTLRVCMF